MTTIKDSFKEAIIQGDWELIRHIFTAVTGEEAPQAKQPKTELEIWQGSLDLPVSDGVRTTGVHEESNDGVVLIENELEDDFSINHGGRLGGKSRGKPVKAGKNQFEDDMSLHAEDTNIIGTQVIRPRGQGTERYNKAQLVTVQCSVCSKREKISPSLAIGYNTDPDENTYKCNSCIASAVRE